MKKLRLSSMDIVSLERNIEEAARWEDSSQQKKKQRNKTNTQENMSSHPRVLTAVEDVAVADLGVNQECWQVLCRYEDKESFIIWLIMNNDYILKFLPKLHDHHLRALSSEDKVLKRLEVSQLLCLDETTIPLLCAGLANVPQVLIKKTTKWY